MNFKGTIEEILLEASKVDTLVNKLGYNEKDAQEIESLCGGLSVWIGRKIFEHLVSRQMSQEGTEKDKAIQNVRYYFKSGNPVSIFRNEINSIMDWFRVGLNGNIKQHEGETLSGLFQLSKQWHDELRAGDGDVNYNEENTIVRDYREDGIGLYWVDLETNNSDEECNRMGHCGRTNSSNTILSLRQVKKFNEKYTVNKSLLTMALGKSDGIIFQLKGPKNSKPDAKYNPYIVDLILHDDNIKGFGNEYNSENDFSITDLPEEEIRKIYQAKPELFGSRKLKKLLMKMGLIEKKEINTIFDLELSPSDIHYYVDGDWDVRKYKDRDGRQRSIGMFETLLSGDHWDLFDNYGSDWQSALDYYIDKENETIIWDMIKSIANPDELEGMSLDDAIGQFDNDHEIRNAIGNAMSSAESDSYYNYYIKTLRNALEEYGDVSQLNDEGVKIRIDLQKIIDETAPDEGDLDDMFERCDEDAECVFRELIGDYYDKPDFRLDDRWSPDINERNFNEILNSYLGDVRM